VDITVLYLAILGSTNYKVLITGAALDEENVCVECDKTVRGRKTFGCFIWSETDQY